MPLGAMGISPRQFADLQRRLAGQRRGTTPVPGADTHAPAVKSILGVDPSLRGTGWGVLVVEGRQPRAVAHGTIACPKGWPRSRCLFRIAEALRDVLRDHPTEVCAIEGLFYAQNLQTAIIMGEARGAALATIAASGIPIFEIPPAKVKQAIVGHGGAQKFAVAKMVQRMTGLADLPEPDAADALAVALAYLGESGRFSTRPPKPL
ncbi:MAG: crossover junction endodeoxyribonuclease RuvC [Verrucomicrobia bacterium]|nr:MAG: crossover junction endodeoxyribonuclease RuvC [Verrucomicrobiota bacterium]